MRSLARGLTGRAKSLSAITAPRLISAPRAAVGEAFSLPLHQCRRLASTASVSEMAPLESLKESLPADDFQQWPLTDGKSLTAEEQEQLWLRAMEAKYGEGSYQLFRPLYKDLCDEMRREYYTKPPPPFAVVRGHEGAAKGREKAADKSAGSLSPSSAAAATDPVGWSVVYQPANNLVVFRRDAVESFRQGCVVAYSKVEIGDPPRLNALLTFADWCPIEVMVERKGVIVHFSVACNEGGMHMRNVRVYRSPTLAGERAEAAGAGTKGRTAEERQLKSDAPTASSGETAASHKDGTFHRKHNPQQPQPHPTPANILDATDDAEWCRQNLCYDGPCLWHLELDFLNELYDIMQDHGITLDWIRWAAEWVHYLEHVNYTRWSVGVLEELVPSSHRGPEEDFLTEDERAALDEPAEDWLSARAI